MSELITVLTPTYNRKDKLFSLYDSLLQQSVDERFIWFIADDGSTDGTKELFKEWDSRKEERKKFSILYRWYENGGKHRAINRAMKEIETELTFIVDSDDILTADAILTISKAYERAGQEHIENLCGFSFQRMTKDGSLMCRKVARDGMLGTYCGERINKRNPGDMAEVWFTDILRKFPFPEYEGENFLGEDTVWIRMSGPYRIQFFNQTIYLSGYLEGGLTNTRRTHNLHSPKGCTQRARTFLSSGDIHGICKIKPAMQYMIYGRLAGETTSALWKTCPGKAKKYFVLFFLPALVLEYRWRKLL